MLAISLWQPWASLIAIGAKPFETRSWCPSPDLIGERIAIHAAKKPVFPIVVQMDSATLEAIEGALGVHGDVSWPRRMPLDVIVCTAVLAGAVQCDGDPESYFDYFGDYSPGRWAWRLTDVEKLEPPVPAAGTKQGFWEWSP